MSIFEGIKELVKPWSDGSRNDFENLPLISMFQCLERNFSPSSPNKLSQENWRFTKNIELGVNNPSLEKVLEYKISEFMGVGWANQVPAASGFFGSGGRKRSVDLIVESSDSIFTFYELKVSPKSGNAFSASIELIEYALAYIYSRIRLTAYNEKPLMKAKTVHLMVLGTTAYYDALTSEHERRRRSGVKLRREKCVSPSPEMEGGINLSLKKFWQHLDVTCSLDCKIDFGFSTFPKSFSWAIDDLKIINAKKVRHAVNGIHPLFSGPATQ
jgi:hypothetical protein